MKLEQEIKHRSSHQRCSVKIGVLKNFAKFIGKHLYKSLFFNKVSRPGSEAVVQRCSVKKGVLGNFTKFTGKHLSQSLYFNKVAGPATLLKKRLWHRCFPVNFAKFPRTPFFTEHLRWLLL